MVSSTANSPNLLEVELNPISQEKSTYPLYGYLDPQGVNFFKLLTLLRPRLVSSTL